MRAKLRTRDILTSQGIKLCSPSLPPLQPHGQLSKQHQRALVRLPVFTHHLQLPHSLGVLDCFPVGSCERQNHLLHVRIRPRKITEQLSRHVHDSNAVLDRFEGDGLESVELEEVVELVNGFGRGWEGKIRGFRRRLDLAEPITDSWW